ncbi:MAG: DUF6495 family protein [Flavobacteriales bacterium]|jgi:hypothetical protein|nr:DUF6495 family protein [Flavobacteriales bacterium]
MEAKFRLLTKEELESLQPEFIQYLAANGIDASKWQEIIAHDTQEMDLHLASFSDLVMQKSLEKVKYIEHRTTTDLKLFFFDQKEAFLIALKSKTIDLEHLEKLNSAQLDQIDLFKANKTYTSTREAEIFDLLNKGCVISKGTLYSQLKAFVQ